MTLALLELWLGRIAGAAGLLTLAAAVAAMFGSLRRRPGRQEPRASHLLRAPVLAISTLLFLGVGAILWRPLPVRLADTWRAALALLGTPVFFGGLGLYVWGLKTLGAMFGPSSGFGAQLYTGHRLVTTGPYARVRHPMYLAVIGAGAGSLLLYRTWATLGFAAMGLGLWFRARREERLLALEFGEAWREYAARVPAWLPRRRAKDAG